MKYSNTIDGVSIERRYIAEQFATGEDIQTLYSIICNGDCIDEDVDTQDLAKRLKKAGDRLHMMSRFLSKKKKL